MGTLRSQLLVIILMTALWGCGSSEDEIKISDGAISPNGSYFAALARDPRSGSITKLQVMSLNSSGRSRSYRAPREDMADFGWSPDSRYLAFVLVKTGVRILDTHDGSWSPASVNATPAWGQMAWSPDGKKLAWLCPRPRNDYSLLIIDIERNLTHERLSSRVAGFMGPGSLHSLSWAPDGKTIYLLMRNLVAGREFSRIQPDAGPPEKINSADPRTNCFVVSPDGSSMVLQLVDIKPWDDARWQGWIRVLDLRSNRSWPISDKVGSVVYSPDSRRLVYEVRPPHDIKSEVPYSLWIRDLAEGSRPRRLVPKTGGLLPGSWTPQGRIYFLSEDRCSLWSIRPDGAQLQKEFPRPKA